MTFDSTPALQARIGTRLAPYLRPAMLGLSIFGFVLFAWLMLVVPGRPDSRELFGFDSYAYWRVDAFHPYAIALGTYGSFTYSPAIALVAAPARLLPFGLFFFLWDSFLIVALVWLTRRMALVWLVFLPVSFELLAGNIHILLALICVLGFEYPALWSIGLLTKITPGVSLLWFVVRREWRSLAVALGATAVIAAVSFVVAPGAWFDWANFLTTSGATGAVPNDRLGFIMPPWWLRLALAALLVAWGARTDRRWVLPVATTLALPVIWINSLAILVAVPRLRGGRASEGQTGTSLQSR